VRRGVTLAVCTGLVVLAFPAGAQEVASRTYRAADSSTVLVHELAVPASVAAVWQAFTTSEGLMTWAVPFASVDFRVGGVWESSYDAGAKPGADENIRTRYLSFVPGRMIAMQAVGAPPGFPHPEVLPDLFSVVEFEPVGADTTLVRMYGVGYRDTPEHTAVRRMFRDANAWTLRMLHRRFTVGPTDWSSTRVPAPAGD
jgi:uncharacterized protein YndB with AHSA1/START domain